MQGIAEKGIALIVNLVQCVVSSDIETNIARIKAALDNAAAASWTLFPEGMLSGYAPEHPEFIARLDGAAIKSAIRDMNTVANEQGKKCVFGTAYPEEGRWYNASVACVGLEHPIIYQKNNLARLDHAHFVQGDSLPTYAASDCTFGIQMCRELLFPEQWRALKLQHAQVIFHINNAIQPYDAVWRHVIITRALENQVYVVSVNNAASPQALPSMVVSPKGEILAEIDPLREQRVTADLDLSLTSEYYIQQNRDDLASVQYNVPAAE